MRRINIFWSIILLFFSAYSQNENLRPEQILKEHRAIPVSDCSKIDSVVALAESKKGCAYRYGTAGPSTFDCSGLMYYVHKQFGLTLPRSSPDLYFVGKKVDKKDIRRGDLVFFHRYKRSVGHVGMVVEVDSNHHFTFIHASTHKKGVRYDRSNSDYYAREYVGARRIFECDGDGMPTLPEDTLPEITSDSLKNVGVVSSESNNPAQNSLSTSLQPQPKLIYYKVKSGDTLSKIAKKYHVYVSQLKKWNHLKSDFIREGQKLKIYK